MATAKIIFLIVSIGIPGHAPINHSMPMQSFEDCWTAAKEFAERDLSEQMRSQGVVGLAATCGYQEQPSQTN